MGYQRYQNRREPTPEEEEKQSAWYLLTGLILGLLLGLAYTWWINPVAYQDTSPASLKEPYKDQYRSIIAQVYVETGDLTRAQSRLALLKDADPILALGAQAQKILAQTGSEAEARALAMLAAALQTQLTPTPSLTETQVTNVPSPTATQAATTSIPTNTLPAPSVTPTPTPTETLSFELDSQEVLCDPTDSGPLLEIFVYDAAGLPLPGVELRISWLGGEETFYTGLKQDISPGYADFQMEIGETYALTVAGGETVLDLRAQECALEEEAETYWGGWSLIFQAP
jgi:hypothetical protein